MPKNNFIKSLFIIALFISFFSFSQERKNIAVYFDFDKYEITPKAKSTLDSLISLAKNSRAYTIRINAFTDSKGSKEYNLILANNRKKTISDYLIQNQLNFKRVSCSQLDDNLENIPDDLRRKAVIEIEYINSKIFSGKKGTQVTAGENDKVTVNEYFSAKEMIRDSKFAIDDKEQIIRSDGMLTICYEAATLDESGNFYIVEMPSRGLNVDRSMNIFLEITNDKGEKRWKQTEIKLDFDTIKNRYIFKIP
ncbi:MAG: OmpA family protein, partial [Flavobacterium sp.]